MQPTFKLEKGEKVIKEFERLQYVGMQQQMIGAGIQGAFGTTFAGGTIKKDKGSMFYAKNAYLFVTNKRLVLCAVKTGFMSVNVKEVKLPMAEIYLKDIQGFTNCSPMGHKGVEISVKKNGELETNKIVFLMSGFDKREKEVEELKRLIK
jgi:hypothetical protein